MSYRDQLYPWCIIFTSQEDEKTTVQRFRQRDHAEAHLKILQHITPYGKFGIIFDRSSEDSISSAEN
jgi:hypothetical protein